MSIITDSKYESASYFCIWYYQNRRGLIKKKDATLVQAKEIYLDLFEDFTEDERVELRSEINLLLKNNDCINRFKEQWLSIGNKIQEILNDFRYDETLNIDEDQRYKIAQECDPTFLTSYIYDGNHDDEFTKFIKTYYDIGKQNAVSNKIPTYSSVKEESIIWLVEEYLKIHTNMNYKITHKGVFLFHLYKINKKKSIVHLLHIYKEHYKIPRAQAIFKMMFQKTDLSLSKADKLILLSDSEEI